MGRGLGIVLLLALLRETAGDLYLFLASKAEHRPLISVGV